MREIDKMLDGKLYNAQDKALVFLRKKARKLIGKLNRMKPGKEHKRVQIIEKLFSFVGENASITPPFYCDYGFNIKVGKGFYANYHCVLLDVNEIMIGDYVLLGPNVQIYTASHPLDKDVRKLGLEYGLKVQIGNDVWIGGHTVINPGITIGNNVIIGSGSVVTKDIPDGVIAAGNPCKVIRMMTEEDKKYWEKQVKADNQSK